MKIYEKAWIIAAFTGLTVGLYNAFTYRIFNETVYFPITVAGLCIIVYFTKRNHRLFMEKMRREKAANKADL